MSKCPHPIDTRADDLATGDLFCGDCGAVLEPFDNQPRRLAGEDAATAIASKLAEEASNLAGSVTVYSVTPVADHSFDVTVRISVKGDQKWRNFRIERDAKNHLTSTLIETA